jgi:hypothetical protein
MVFEKVIASGPAALFSARRLDFACTDFESG